MNNMHPALDYDDLCRMRDLCKNFETNSKLLNDCLELCMECELTLDMGIVEENITDKLSWKKQCLELIKVNNKYSQVYLKYMKTKNQIRVCNTSLKSIETEINCIKKTLEVTPK